MWPSRVGSNVIDREENTKRRQEDDLPIYIICMRSLLGWQGTRLAQNMSKLPQWTKNHRLTPFTPRRRHMAMSLAMSMAMSMALSIPARRTLSIAMMTSKRLEPRKSTLPMG